MAALRMDVQRNLAYVFRSDMLDFDNPPKRNLCQLVGFFDALRCKSLDQGGLPACEASSMRAFTSATKGDGPASV
jgi:hypothetical protein